MSEDSCEDETITVKCSICDEISSLQDENIKNNLKNYDFLNQQKNDCQDSQESGKYVYCVSENKINLGQTQQTLGSKQNYQEQFLLQNEEPTISLTSHQQQEDNQSTESIEAWLEGKQQILKEHKHQENCSIQKQMDTNYKQIKVLINDQENKDFDIQAYQEESFRNKQESLSMNKNKISNFAKKLAQQKLKYDQFLNQQTNKTSAQLKDYIEKLNLELNKLIQENNNYQNQLEKLNYKNSQFDKQIIYLENQLKESKKENNCFIQDKDNLENENYKLKKENQRFQEQKEQQQALNITLQNQILELKNEQINMQKKLQDQQLQERKLQIQILQMEQKICQLINQNNLYQKDISDIQLALNNQTKLNEHQNQISFNQNIEYNTNNSQKLLIFNNITDQYLSNQNKNQNLKSSLSSPVNPMQLKQIYDRKSLSSLIEEYKHNPNIKKIITDLQLKFDTYRSVRGDGNCYFRAVGFAFLEHLVRYTTPVQHLEDFINKMEINIGYYQVRSKSHSLRSNFLSLLQNLKQKKERNDASIQQYLIQLLQHNQHDYDEALIWQMRSLTANYLESHQEYFLPFSQVPYEQIIRNVLTMGKEADGIGIGPLQVVLKLKIEIVTIDRNYQEVLSFDQMKIAGKCPLIFILYKPGHYDIIYSKDQSKADGFDEIKEQYTNQVQLPQKYDLNSPGQPFFVEIEGNGQECPTNEFKVFEIKYDQAYQSTGDSMQTQVEYIETEKGINTKIEKCEICQQEIEIIQFIELQCHHRICNYCLQDKIEQDTGGKIILNSNEKGTRANCMVCKRELTEKEMEGIIGKEKIQQLKEKAALRQNDF